MASWEGRRVRFPKKCECREGADGVGGLHAVVWQGSGERVSVHDIEQLLEMTGDVDTTAAMLTIGHAAAFSEQFVDRTDYKATVRQMTEAALRQGTDARAAIETQANDHYETAKAFAHESARLLDEGRIVGTAQVRTFIAERATSHLAAWTLYRLRLQSAYDDSLASTGTTQIASGNAGRDKIERALRTLGRHSSMASDSNDYATTVIRTIIVAVMERASRPLLSLDDDGRFIGAIFTFVASDIVSRMTGADFEVVSSVAVITLFLTSITQPKAGRWSAKFQRPMTSWCARVRSYSKRLERI